MKELQLKDHLNRNWTVIAYRGGISKRHRNRWLCVWIRCRVTPDATRPVCDRRACWHPIHGWDTTLWYPKAPRPMPADILKQIIVFLRQNYAAIAS